MVSPGATNKDISERNYSEKSLKKLKYPIRKQSFIAKKSIKRRLEEQIRYETIFLK